MSNEIFYPSLSETGWTGSSEQIADALFSDFYESNFSQTNIYKGQVASFAYAIQSCQGDIQRTISTLENVLKSYFLRYFKAVDVEVRDVSNEVPGTDSNSSLVSLGIYLSFTDTDDKTFNLSRVIQNAGTKTAKVIKINNGV